jgi:hypothetical protein
MIRAATILWVALAALVGVGLFQLKHEVQALDEELVRLNRQIAEEHRTIHVLKAEWSYINQPQRLERLAQRHLDLVPMMPQQITRLGDVPRRPPAPPAGAEPAPTAGPAHARPHSQLVGGHARTDATPRAVQPVRAPVSGAAVRPVADGPAAPRSGAR